MKSTFFETLSRNLNHSKYSERLQEELAAHIEDAVLDLAWEGIQPEQATQQAIQTLGDPKVIAREYNTMLKQQSPYINIITLILITLFTTVIFKFLPIIISIVAGNTIGDNPKYPLFTISWLAIPITAVIFLLFFLLVLPSLYQWLHQSKQRLIIYVSILGLPSLLTLRTIGKILLNAYFDHWQIIKPWNLVLVTELIIPMFIIIIMGLCIWLVIGLIKQEEKHLLKIKNDSMLPTTYLGSSCLIYVIVSYILYFYHVKLFILPRSILSGLICSIRALLHNYNCSQTVIIYGELTLVVLLLFSSSLVLLNYYRKRFIKKIINEQLPWFMLIIFIYIILLLFT
ncbi:MAG: permease prefix domain 1-containing protein [Patescibacteria group bacterium]|jgi:hypothetical protein